MKWGLIDTLTNKIISKPTYNKIYNFRKGFAWFKIENNEGVLNEFGQELLRINNGHIYLYDNSIIVKSSKYYHALNYNLDTIIPPLYKSLFNKGSYFFAKKNDKWGVLDFNNNIIIPFEYEYLEFWIFGKTEYFSKNIKAKRDGKWGIINLNNEIIIPFENNEFFNGIFENQNDRKNQGITKFKGGNYKYGCIDSTGKTVIQPIYDEIEFNENFFKVKKNDLWGLLNHQGNIIVDVKYDWPPSINNGIITIYENLKITLYDSIGTKLNNQKYDFVGNRKDNFIVVKYENKYNYINHHGIEQFKNSFQNAFPFENNWASILIDNKAYLLNMQGKMICVD